MATKPKAPDPWRILNQLIANYRDAAIADSWSGGGDPDDVDLLRTRRECAHLELDSHIRIMKRSLE